MPRFIESMRAGPEGKIFGEFRSRNLAFLVLSKCILGTSQLQVRFRGGEVYINNATTSLAPTDRLQWRRRGAYTDMILTGHFGSLLVASELKIVAVGSGVGSNLRRSPHN